mmetsp:Transcript_36756/g.89202  ORF Transcript_36756/g.89202 Transcript_36756/m.89202 type:complete len:201 (+) Transcript_36756:1911-2513(+)
MTMIPQGFHCRQYRRIQELFRMHLPSFILCFSYSMFDQIKSLGGPYPHSSIRPIYHPIIDGIQAKWRHHKMTVVMVNCLVQVVQQVYINWRYIQYIISKHCHSFVLHRMSIGVRFHERKGCIDRMPLLDHIVHRRVLPVALPRKVDLFPRLVPRVVILVQLMFARCHESIMSIIDELNDWRRNGGLVLVFFAEFAVRLSH